MWCEMRQCEYFHLASLGGNDEEGLDAPVGEVAAAAVPVPGLHLVLPVQMLQRGSTHVYAPVMHKGKFMNIPHSVQVPPERHTTLEQEIAHTHTQTHTHTHTHTHTEVRPRGEGWGWHQNCKAEGICRVLLFDLS